MEVVELGGPRRSGGWLTAVEVVELAELPDQDAPRGTLLAMRLFRRLHGAAKDPSVLSDDPRVDGWETVSAFEDQSTALAWRDQLRALGVDATCVSDHPLDQFGRGDIYLVVAPEQWSRANEILENLD